MPDATPQQMEWFNELQRVTTRPDVAARLMNEAGHINVMQWVPKVKVPTIVFHCEHETNIPFKEGQMLAKTIPNAKFVPLPSRNHLVLESETAWPIFVRELGNFLGWSHAK